MPYATNTDTQKLLPILMQDTLLEENYLQMHLDKEAIEHPNCYASCQ